MMKASLWLLSIFIDIEFVIMIYFMFGLWSWKGKFFHDQWVEHKSEYLFFDLMNFILFHLIVQIKLCEFKKNINALIQNVGYT